MSGDVRTIMFVKPYAAGEPYSARRVASMRNKLERLATRADMLDLLEAGLDAFIAFQDDLARLQALIQKDIGSVKKTVRKNKDAIPALEYLRELRWYARCVGDSLAWQVFFFNRKAIAALMTGSRPPIAEITYSTQAVISMAGYLLGQKFGIPIIHDITNWLRIGDITFARLTENPDDRRFQTVELKSSLIDSTTLEDGSTYANMTVNVYCNEPMDLLRPIAKDPKDAKSPTLAVETSNQAPTRKDRRLDRQFERLDIMKNRRDMVDNSITKIDGIPNINLRIDREEGHRWHELRRAIRAARRSGFSFFSIDNFIAYGIWYQKGGVSAEHLHSYGPTYAKEVAQNFLK
jgi:hypothetical protein